MRKGLLDILKGRFLISGDAPKNWMFLLFASFLAALMISSSHNADRKVLEIAELNEEVRKLKSEFLKPGPVCSNLNWNQPYGRWWLKKDWCHRKTLQEK